MDVRLEGLEAIHRGRGGHGGGTRKGKNAGGAYHRTPPASALEEDDFLQDDAHASAKQGGLCQAAGVSDHLWFCL